MSLGDDGTGTVCLGQDRMKQSVNFVTQCIPQKVKKQAVNIQLEHRASSQARRGTVGTVERSGIPEAVWRRLVFQWTGFLGF